MKKKLNLDEYEKELLELAEEKIDDFRPAPQEELRKYQEMARRTLAKDARINIRISSRDLLALKRKANRYGMPYQTLIASVLHRYAAGELEQAEEKR